MAPNFPHHIQGMVLRALGITPPAFPYGAITLFGGPFQGTSGRRAGVDPRPITPHLHEVIPHGFGLGSSPFPRRYSGNPILVSSPPPTWMFPFGGFPIPGQSPGSEAERPKPRPLGDPIRRSPDQRLPAATRGFSQLATSFLGARAEASTGRRPQAWDLSFAVVSTHGEQSQAPRAIGSGGLKASGTKASALTPPPHQTRLLREPSSKAEARCRAT